MNWLRSSLLSLTVCIGLVAASPVRAQTRVGKVYTVVEKAPEFPGGKLALSMYLAENIRYPNSLSRKNVVVPPVSARFIIDEIGRVSDVRVISKPLAGESRKGMEEYMATIIAAVEKMPRWQPGEVANQPVPVFYTLPIEISLK